MPCTRRLIPGILFIREDIFSKAIGQQVLMQVEIITQKRRL